MAFLGFGKKKEEKKTETCTCSCSCSANEARENADCCCAEAKDGICYIKVLGAGCKSCHELYENTKQAAKVVGISTKVEYITDMQKVMGYGVMRLPALVINEKVVMQGKLMKADEIENCCKTTEHRQSNITVFSDMWRLFLCFAISFV